MQLEAARRGTFFRLLVMLVVAGQVPDGDGRTASHNGS